MSRFKLQLEDCHDARVRGERVIDTHPWHGDGGWERFRNLEGRVIGYVIRRKGGTRTASGVDR